jgi:hypothetical protein
VIAAGFFILASVNQLAGKSSPVWKENASV